MKRGGAKRHILCDEAVYHAAEPSNPAMSGATVDIGHCRERAEG